MSTAEPTQSPRRAVALYAKDLQEAGRFYFRHFLPQYQRLAVFAVVKQVNGNAPVAILDERNRIIEWI